MEKIFETKYVVVTDDVSSLLCLCFYAALRDRDDDHQILTSLHKYKYTNWAYFRFCHGTCYVNRVAVDNFSYLPTLAKSHDLSPNFAKRILILGLRHTNNMCPSVRLLCFLETIWRRSEASAIDPALRFRTLDCQSMNDGYGAWRWDTSIDCRTEAAAFKYFRSDAATRSTGKDACSACSVAFLFTQLASCGCQSFH